MSDEGGGADTVRAWVAFHPPDDEERGEQAVALLRRAGLDPYRPRHGRTEGPGVLLFTTADHAVAERLGGLGDGGRHRILAVALTRTALDGAGPWPLLRAGATDVLTWDASATPAEDAVRRLRRWAAVDALVASPLVSDNLVGAGPAWQRLLRDIVEMAVYSDASVLVTGESGTGKELVARLVHALDPRRGAEQLVLLDCTTIVPALAGSEFFGHEKGAFTGALASRDGAFALADRGTLFLDEVGELPLELQAELLRVVQEGTYKRVGSNTWHTTGFRLVCATNRDLTTDEGARRFRGDLYHRIAAWTCRLPSLRERPEDILPLARHFLRDARQGDGTPGAEDFDPAVCRLLMERHYPGNVRELRQLVGRMARRHVGSGLISAGDVPPEERPPGAGPDSGEPPRGWPDAGFEESIRTALASGVCLKEIGVRARETAVLIAVREADGNLQEAARALGVTDRALQLRRRAANGAPEG
ncbi:sigma 54-interacting transcriptional regulator [Streptomyces nymphaeiformis]|uniref:Transcriptional regulator with GAF, ATPase, and Fis domain n=1 Tax=Streptomyces nymphaeiformis TaxID=2663842 RepID=A0A7W7TWR3_9ACTN|nr:sigma 54-interacting transcriptional regulator [Streptomyces nymphaeiformis]MBB4980486.1 transcriptional regulator with GAF, ATPase, and Fis domain [Streptomyces nymphaeiformis]